jgi:hypothetical protein
LQEAHVYPFNQNLQDAAGRGMWLENIGGQLKGCRYLHLSRRTLQNLGYYKDLEELIKGKKY